MNKAISIFRENIERVRHLGGINAALRSLTTGVVDTSDILRAQIVLALSALDHYIHEITVAGMIEILSGTRPSTDAFLKFRVSMDVVISSGATNRIIVLEAEIRERHSYLSFQHPDKIADAIRLFSDVQLWRDVSAIMSMPAPDIKNTLRLIVDRRNKIAHEADIDPSYPGSRWPISDRDVNGAINFIESLCEAINTVVI